MKTEVKTPSVTISISSIDHMLDGHACTRKRVIASAESNCLGMKEKQPDLAQCPNKESVEKFWLHIDETNFTFTMTVGSREAYQILKLSLFLMMPPFVDGLTQFTSSQIIR